MSSAGTQMAYKPGDIIQKNCVPLFSVNQFMTMNKGKFCDVCFHPATATSEDQGSNQTQIPNTEANKHLQKCSKCKLMCYCSKTCQTKDWNDGHKVEYKSETWRRTFDGIPTEEGEIQEGVENSQSEAELRSQLFRAVAVLKMNPQLLDQQFQMYDGSNCTLNECLGNPNRIAEPFVILRKNHHTHLRLLCVRLATEIDDEKLMNNGNLGSTYELLVKLAGIIMASTDFDSRMATPKSPGRINIFIERAVLKHSCKPTAVFCHNDMENKADIRAIADIPEGKKPTISYIDCFKPKQERQLILKNIHDIDCNCERCVTHSDASIDFDQLYAHQNYFKEICSLGKRSGIAGTGGKFYAYSFKNFVKKHEEMMSWLNQMYHKYDEHVSNHYLGIVIGISLCFADSKHILHFMPQMNKLMEEAQQHMSITHGEEHEDYNGLTQIIEAMKNKSTNL